ncbi:MAG: hypothetical protein NT166_11500 [Candidatus Aminicenantes bacterium]|nr:hypothetical protein [Candidatus Aminicenantes bacterium]
MKRTIIYLIIVGSTMDVERGIFYWQPGPGFVGRYRLVFIKKDSHGRATRKDIIVEILIQSSSSR